MLGAAYDHLYRESHLKRFMRLLIKLVVAQTLGALEPRGHYRSSSAGFSQGVDTTERLVLEEWRMQNDVAGITVSSHLSP